MTLVKAGKAAQDMGISSKADGSVFACGCVGICGCLPVIVCGCKIIC